MRACNLGVIGGYLRVCLAAIMVLSWMPGCATPGTSLQLGGGAAGKKPSVREILDDLGSNDRAIGNFRSAGTFLLESPKLTAAQKFRGSVKYRRPNDLYVRGNHRLTGITLFRLTASGTEFVMEFPGSREENFYQLEGDYYEDVEFSVAPTDIAREMFLSEDWSSIGRREARLVIYSPEEGEAALEIGPRSAPRRNITVRRVQGDPATWVVVRNRRLNADGATVAETLLADYRLLDGAMFPASIDARFPTESTRMQFSLRNIRLNRALEDVDFDVAARAAELELVPVSRAGL